VICGDDGTSLGDDGGLIRRNAVDKDRPNARTGDARFSRSARANTGCRCAQYAAIADPARIPRKLIIGAANSTANSLFVLDAFIIRFLLYIVKI